LGAPAYTALARSETVPALRATREGSPLDTLVRLFLLQRPVPAPAATAALPLEECVEDGWVVHEGDLVRATVDVRPYGGPEGQDWFIV
ncbi:transferase, partial [Streptomyces sp. CHB19.2]|nr:transferase [Streptomyces sp. CHB19.2]